MRSLLAIFGSMLCVLVMTACAIDDEPASKDNSAAMSSDSSEIAVPPELSFDALEEAATGDEFTGDTDDRGREQRCEVKKESCHDGHPPYAKFCWMGDCKGHDAYEKAKYKCEKECKSKSACKKMEVYRCKHH
jgi:hypothetical protein